MRGRFRFTLIGAFRDEKLGRNIQKRRAADELEVRQHHERGEDHGKNDPQKRGEAGAKDEPPAPLLLGQSAARHGNHNGVVTGQQSIDEDDLDYGEPKGRMAELIDPGIKPISPQDRIKIFGD